MKDKIKNTKQISRCMAFVALFASWVVLSPLWILASANELEDLQNTTTRVTGVVLEEGVNEPLIGVSIVVKGLEVRTLTDVDGRFTIDMPYAGASLVFSYIGFQSKEVKPNGKNELRVLLQEDSKALQEVVIVGHSKQRKETMIGSVSTISTKDLQQSPTANINNALAGRLPGLIANQYAGGEPGVDKSEIFIRGKSTTNNQAPIVIIDGVERDMTYLAPEEMESFTILKDASATAQYGIRGANGVIVITTKRGKATEKPSVNFKASLGVANPIKFPDYLGSADYATLYNEARLNDAKITGEEVPANALFSADAISKFRRAKGDNSDGLGYDWDYYDMAFKPALQQEYSLSVRGGSDRVRYYVMANYFKQGGNYRYTDNADYDGQAKLDRYNFRNNVDIEITKHWSVRLDLGARITERNAPGTSANKVMTLAATQAPNLPLYVEENNHMQNELFIEQNPYGMLYGDQVNRFNIIGELGRSGYLNEKNTYMEGTFATALDMGFLLEGLKAEVSFSYDGSEGRWIRRDMGTYKEGYKEFPKYATFEPIEGSGVYMTPGHYYGAYKIGNNYAIDQTLGESLSHNASDSRVYFQGKVEYNNTFNNVHEVSAMFLGNRSRRRKNAELAFNNEGVTGRFAYYYDKKYLSEINFGYNGSENFSKNNRYGFFPAASLGWVMSNEDFMEKSRNWLDMFKFRVSYGLVGNDFSGGRFPYLSYYGGGSGYHFGSDFGNNLSGLNEGGVANPNLKWEKAKKFNAGIDIVMLNQKLTLTIDAFHENRYDIIQRVSDTDGSVLGNPTIAGLGGVYMNLGQIYNRGFDLELGWHDNIGRDFRYYIKPNMTFARNKIINKGEIDRKNPWSVETGKRLYENFVYVFDHFVKDQAEADRLNDINYQPWGTLIPGDVVYKDLDRNGVVDEDDRMAMGHPRSPEIMFGIPVGMQYKDFDFSLLFQGAANTSIMLNGPAVYDFAQFDHDRFGKVKKMHLKRWTPETADVAKYPALHYGTHDNNKNSSSSLFLYDAKYIRLKSVEMGYNIPHKLLRKFGLQQVRFYVQGLNLLTWDGLKDIGIDPETKSGNGAEWYPIQKVVNFGIDVTF